MLVEPVTLDGSRVRLEPMLMSHLDALVVAGGFEELWTLIRSRAVTRDEMKLYLEDALATQRDGSALPFVTVDKASGAIIGSTRFGNIDAANRRVEIGWTWITPAFQRTHVNSEAKLLMLRHAFEVWGCVRVELKTDALNDRSQAAMLRIGATREGVLRKHMIVQKGRFRDTVYFSILDTEWPTISARLQSFVSRK